MNKVDQVRDVMSYINTVYATAKLGEFTTEIVLVMFITFPLIYSVLFGITTAGVYRKAGVEIWRAFVPYTNVKSFCKIIYGEEFGMKRYHFCVKLYFFVTVTGAYVATHYYYLLLLFPVMSGVSYYKLCSCFNLPKPWRILGGLCAAIPSHGLLVTLIMGFIPKVTYIGPLPPPSSDDFQLPTHP